jgi:MSHA pilin protein MshD
MFTRHKQLGISLIELIMFIVIMSIALTGAILAINQMTRNCPNTLLRKEALTVAESLLEKLEQTEAQNFSSVITASMVTLVNNALPASGVTAASAVLSSGSVSAVNVTVTVTDITGQSYSLTGYPTYHY